MRPAEKARVILAELESLRSPANVAGMARYGIRSAKAYGVPGPEVRRIARESARDHALAATLWKSGWLEARMVAVLTDDPRLVTREQMERWARDFDSWAICDGASCQLFDRTPHAVVTAREWAGRSEEYVKRAGFVIMAGLAVHDKAAPDSLFLEFLGIIERAADDPRNMVRKGINWALRQIGKRNMTLNEAAVEVCRRLVAGGGPARWVGSDALRELTSEKTVGRIRKKKAGVRSQKPEARR